LSALAQEEIFWNKFISLRNGQGPKLYSKVLTIEPNRLLSKCCRLNKGAYLSLFFFIVPLLDDRSKSPHTTMNCRVKRHLISTSSHMYGQPAEIKPEAVICKHN
jgi:hypothetical protein